MDYSNFSISIYGKLEKFNEVLSKARCRIFYKYKNRNGSYITDEFADKLVRTLPYSPIKGIYNEDDSDYTDHGEQRSEGRIYGIVPQDYNFAWEDHLDKDGIVRTYACTDVLLFTSIYEEAGNILSKPQSMELYSPSIKGEWKVIDGQEYFVYTDGCFLGLQILGKNTEPCFEGASFFSLYSSLKELCDKIDKGGKEPMKNLFKLAHEDIYCKLFDILNPNFNEENSYKYDFSIVKVYDSYVVAEDCAEKQLYRIEYTKKDDNSIELGQKKKCFIVEVTEEEMTSLEAIQAVRGNFTNLIEDFNKIAELEEQKITFEQSINELNTTIENKNSLIDSLNNEITNYTNDNQTMVKEINKLNIELDELNQYKYNIELKEKQKIIEEYSMLSEEIRNKYLESIDNFSAIELDKELAYELKNSKPEIFSKQNSTSGYIPKDVPLTGLAAVLSKYKQ